MKQRLEKKKKTITPMHWILTLLVLTTIEFFLLAASAFIPRSAIRSHTLESAEYFMQNPVFYRMDDTNPASTIDHYADAILLNILYHFDEKHPFHSSLSSSYYHTDTNNENQNLYTTITTETAANYEYSRYWHGSAILIRPLLTFLSIPQIYCFFAILLLVLLLLLIRKLIKSQYKACAGAICISLFAVSFWYIPMSLEYIWCFLIMLIAALCTVCIYNKTKQVCALFFFVIGNVTAYFDFLTTETITLLFPLSLLLVCMYEAGQLKDFKSGFWLICFRGLAWIGGYISSWIAKWTLASIFLHKNVFASSLSAAEIRIYGDTDGMNAISLALSGLAKNITCLFPFNFIQKNGWGWGIFSFIILMLFYYLFRKNGKKNLLPKLFMILFFVPYLRYLTLANHAFLHYFFTYRAQFASIFCLCMVFYYGVDKKLLSKQFRFISGSRNPSR